MDELMNGIRSILEASMAVKPKERVLVIADDESRSMSICQAIVAVANSMDAEPVLTVVPRQKHARAEGAGEPPSAVGAAMKSVEVVFSVSERTNWVHSNARKEATAAGARFYVIGQVPLDDLEQGVSAEDLRLIKERTEKVAQRLTEAKVARVTSPSGTNITMSLVGREGEAHHPLSRIVAGLPYYSEAAVSPVEGTAEGVIIADLAIVQWGYRLREPLKLTVKGGKVADLSGSTQDAERLRNMLARDENAVNIAELGIGTSHIIPWAMHGTRRDGGRIGTAHIGFGRNSDIGGKTWSRIHQDTLISPAAVELDGQHALKNGVLLI